MSKEKKERHNKIPNLKLHQRVWWTEYMKGQDVHCEGTVLLICEKGESLYSTRILQYLKSIERTYEATYVKGEKEYPRYLILRDSTKETKTVFVPFPWRLSPVDANARPRIQRRARQTQDKTAPAVGVIHDTEGLIPSEKTKQIITDILTLVSDEELRNSACFRAAQEYISQLSSKDLRAGDTFSFNRTTYTCHDWDGERFISSPNGRQKTHSDFFANGDVPVTIISRYDESRESVPEEQDEDVEAAA